MFPEQERGHHLCSLLLPKSKVWGDCWASWPWCLSWSQLLLWVFHFLTKIVRILLKIKQIFKWEFHSFNMMNHLWSKFFKIVDDFIYLSTPFHFSEAWALHTFSRPPSLCSAGTWDIRWQILGHYLLNSKLFKMLKMNVGITGTAVHSDEDSV